MRSVDDELIPKLKLHVQNLSKNKQLLDVMSSEEQDFLNSRKKVENEINRFKDSLDKRLKDIEIVKLFF